MVWEWGQLGECGSTRVSSIQVSVMLGLGPATEATG